MVPYVPRLDLLEVGRQECRAVALCDPAQGEDASEIVKAVGKRGEGHEHTGDELEHQKGQVEHRPCRTGSAGKATCCYSDQRHGRASEEGNPDECPPPTERVRERDLVGEVSDHHQYRHLQEGSDKHDHHLAQEVGGARHWSTCQALEGPVLALARDGDTKVQKARRRQAARKQPRGVHLTEADACARDLAREDGGEQPEEHDREGKGEDHGVPAAEELEYLHLSPGKACHQERAPSGAKVL